MKYNKYNQSQIYGKPALNSYGYLVMWNRETNKTEQMSRVIYEELKGTIPKDLKIDHINNKKTDNRIENLQAITNACNSQRNKRGAVNKVKGYKIRPYRARRKFNYKEKHLGYFGAIGGAIMATNMMFIEGET